MQSLNLDFVSLEADAQIQVLSRSPGGTTRLKVNGATVVLRSSGPGASVGLKGVHPSTTGECTALSAEMLLKVPMRTINRRAVDHNVLTLSTRPAAAAPGQFTSPLAKSNSKAAQSSKPVATVFNAADADDSSQDDSAVEDTVAQALSAAIGAARAAATSASASSLTSVPPPTAPQLAKKALGKRRGPAGASPLEGPQSASGKGKETRAPSLTTSAPASASASTSAAPAASTPVPESEEYSAPQAKRSKKSAPAVAPLPLDRVPTYDGTKAGSALPTAWRDRGDGISSSCSASASAATVQGEGQGKNAGLAPGAALPPLRDYIEQAVTKAIADSNSTLSSMLHPCPPGVSAKQACRTLKGPVLLPARIQSSTTIPTARWGHASTMLDARRMLVYGGMDSEQRVLTDSWILDISTGQWSQVPGAAPPRAWHSVTQIADRSWTVTYGEVSGSKTSAPTATGTGAGTGAATGATGNGAGKDGAVCEEVSILDVDVGYAYEPHVKGKLPTRRSGHAAVLVPEAIMPAGSSTAIRPPEPTLVVFGGQRAGAGSSSARTTWHNDVYAWPLGTMHSGPKPTWYKISETQGRQPLPRCYHTAVAVGGSRMVVFGGNNGEDTFADVAFLDCRPTVTRPDAWSWHWPVVYGGGPRPRAGCTAVALGERFILFLGGWDVDEEETQEKLVKAQAAHARAVAKNQAGGTPAPVNVALAPLYEGASGRTTGEPFGEAWLLDMRGGLSSQGEEWEWIRVEPTVQAPPTGSSSSSAIVEAELAYGQYLRTHLARAGHSAVYVQDVRGLVGLTLLQSSSKGGLGMDSSGQSTLLLPPSAEIQGPIPGIVLFGGVKPSPIQGAGMTQASDVVVLALPPALVRAGDAARAAAQRAGLEYEELSRPETETVSQPVPTQGKQDESKDEEEKGKKDEEMQQASSQAQFSPPLGASMLPILPTAAGVGISPCPGGGNISSLAFPSLSQVPLGQADPDPLAMGGEDDWEMVLGVGK